MDRLRGGGRSPRDCAECIKIFRADFQKKDIKNQSRVNNNRDAIFFATTLLLYGFFWERQRQVWCTEMRGYCARIFFKERHARYASGTMPSTAIATRGHRPCFACERKEKSCKEDKRKHAPPLKAPLPETPFKNPIRTAKMQIKPYFARFLFHLILSRMRPKTTRLGENSHGFWGIERRAAVYICMFVSVETSDLLSDKRKRAESIFVLPIFSERRLIPPKVESLPSERWLLQRLFCVALAFLFFSQHNNNRHQTSKK